MTEFEKMSAGKLYDPSDKELATMRRNAHKWSKDYNETYEDEEEKRAELLKKLCPNLGKGTFLQGPVQFDYGVNFFPCVWATTYSSGRIVSLSPRYTPF